MSTPDSHRYALPAGGTFRIFSPQDAEQALQNVMAALAQEHASHSHPDPTIGGDGIEQDIELVTLVLDQLLRNARGTDRVALVHLLCDAYYLKYRRTERPEDLERAISLGEEAESGLVLQDPEHHLASLRTHLGQLYHYKYGKNKSTDDLERALTLARQAVEATPPGAGDRSCRVWLLSNIANDVHSATGREEWIRESVSRMGEAVPPKDGPPNDHELVAMHLLANRLQDNYDLTGTASYLHQAIATAEEVVKHTAKEDPEFGIRKSGLAGKIRARYSRTRDPADLELAITLAEEAVNSSLPQSYIGIVRMGLGALYHQKFDVTGEMEDMEQSLTWTRSAMESMPETDPIRPLACFNLANGYFSKYQAQNNDENTIIRDYRSPESLSLLIGLIAERPEARAERLKLDELDEALKLYKTSLDTLPLGYDKAIVYLTMGHATESRYFRTYMLADLEDAVDLYKKAWQHERGGLVNRIKGARSAGRLYAMQKDFREASHCLSSAVELLRLLSPGSLSRDDQQHMLSQFSGLAAEAASYTLEAGGSAAAGDALRLLEMGRGVMISLTIDLRSDVSDLKARSPRLFEEFDALRRQVNSIAPKLDEASTFKSAQSLESVRGLAAQNRNLEDSYRALQDCIARIRQSKEHKNFLIPMNDAELRRVAKDGAIVVVSSTPQRSDAIIVTSSSVKLRPLPALDHKVVVENMRETERLFAKCSPGTRRATNQKLSALLLWLWEAAVKPVCETLGLVGGQRRKRREQKKTPRIWWIGVGVLSKAPFHAAGDHDSETDNLVSLAISSYTPTIKALAYAQQQHQSVKLDVAKARIEIIGMPETPGYDNSLEAAGMELSEIQGIFGDIHVQPIVLHQPTKAQVVQSLSQHCVPDTIRISHFACHGVSDPTNPLESHVLLYGDERAAAKLSAREISNMEIQGAYLAYLGACHTASTAASNLADESMHVVSSFQLVGFKHVVGNMWKADDAFCRKVSTAFYRFLVAKKQSSPGGRGKLQKFGKMLCCGFESLERGGFGDVSTGLDVAAAFHHAVKSSRDGVSKKDFVAWAPFVHYGA